MDGTRTASTTLPSAAMDAFTLSPGRPTPREAGTAQGVLLTLVSTLSVMGVVLLTPVLPAMQAHYNGVPGSQALVRIGLTVPALCVFLFSPLVGMLSDRVSRRRMLLASMLAYAVFGVAPLFLESLWAIIASRLGVGIAEAMLMTASITLLGDYFDGPARERWFAAQTGMAALSAVGLFLVGGVLGEFGWRMPFLAYGTSLLLFVLLLAFTWEPERRKERLRSSAGFPWAGTRGIYALTLFCALVFYVVPIQLPFICIMRGIDAPSRIGLATAIASAAVPLGSGLFAWRGRISLATVMAVGITLGGAGLLGMSYASGYTALLVAAVLSQLGGGLFIPALLTRAVEGMPFEHRGQASGIWMACFFLGQFASPLVLLAGTQAVGGLLPAVAILGCFCVVGGVLLAPRRGRGRLGRA